PPLMLRSARPSATITNPSTRNDAPPVLGCLVVRLGVPVPPVPVDGLVVVVVDPAGLVVVVLAADELDDDDACAVEGVAAEDDELELDVDELDDDDDDVDDDDEDDAFGLVVVVVADALVDVFFLPPRSPGCATASATPATRRTIAAISRSGARDLTERVTGAEPASPAWKAGALPLSYTREAG